MSVAGMKLYKWTPEHEAALARFDAMNWERADILGRVLGRTSRAIYNHWWMRNRKMVQKSRVELRERNAKVREMYAAGEKCEYIAHVLGMFSSQVSFTANKAGLRRRPYHRIEAKQQEPA